MQLLSNKLNIFNANAELFMRQYMPIIEMNLLAQVSANPKLSEETRNLATAKLEELINNIYGQTYDNGNEKLFK